MSRAFYGTGPEVCHAPGCCGNALACEWCGTEAGVEKRNDGSYLCGPCDTALDLKVVIAALPAIEFVRPRLCADCGAPLKDTLADVCTWCLHISEDVPRDDPYPSTALGRP